MFMESVHVSFFFLLPIPHTYCCLPRFYSLPFLTTLFLTSVRETYITGHNHLLVPEINA